MGKVNPEIQQFEFQPILKKHIIKKEECLVSFCNKSFDMDVSLDHDVLTRRRKTNTNTFVKMKANKFLEKDRTGRYKIPNCCLSNNEDYDINDDLLRLLGWCMTDGFFCPRSCNIHIYQSKINYLTEIEELLNKLNLKYSITFRNRKIKKICGKTVKTVLPSGTFIIHSCDLLKKVREILPTRESIPDWMYQLSDRQVKLLLNTIVKGDGSFRKRRKCRDGYYRKAGMDVVWGKKEFLFSLAGLLVTHNIPCSVNLYKRKDSDNKNYYLQIKKSKNYSLDARYVNKKEYNDIIWCVTTDNGIISVISENGKPYLTGNCAPSGIEKEYVNWDLICYKFLQARFKDNPRIKFDVPLSWWIMTTIKDQKFLMVHGDSIRGINPIKKLVDLEAKMSGILNDMPDYTLAAHFHCPAEQTTNRGRVLINGSFLGGDVFSLKQLHKGCKPEQKVFGIHYKKGITWTYNLDLSLTR